MFASAPPTARRRWVALTVATAVLQLAYWPIVASLGTGDAEQAGLLWLGLAVTPLVFLVLAFGSGHPRAPGATGKAMGLFLLVTLPVGLGNVIIGLVAGFGAAGVVALHRDEDVHSLRARAVAVAGASVYVFVLLLLAEMAPSLRGFALVSGSVVPLAVVGIADEVAEGPATADHQHSSS